VAEACLLPDPPLAPVAAPAPPPPKTANG